MSTTDILVTSSIGLIKENETGWFWLQVIVDNEERELGDQTRHDYHIRINGAAARRMSKQSGIEIEFTDERINLNDPNTTV